MHYTQIQDIRNLSLMIRNGHMSLSKDPDYVGHKSSPRYVRVEEGGKYNACALGCAYHDFVGLTGEALEEAIQDVVHDFTDQDDHIERLMDAMDIENVTIHTPEIREIEKYFGVKTRIVSAVTLSDFVVKLNDKGGMSPYTTAEALLMLADLYVDKPTFRDDGFSHTQLIGGDS